MKCPIAAFVALFVFVTQMPCSTAIAQDTRQTAPNAIIEQSQELRDAIEKYERRLNKDSDIDWIYLIAIYDLAINGDSQALQWLGDHAKRGSVAANSLLGQYWSMKNDGRRAISFYENAAKGGDANSASILADILYEGEYGVAVDEKTGCDWYKVAADGGGSRDQVDYGYKCLDKPAKGYKKDSVEACKWYGIGAVSWYSAFEKNPALYDRSKSMGKIRASQAARAFGLYGNCFEYLPAYKGRMVEGASWIKRASEFGSNYATFAYGGFLEQGLGVAQNYEEAVRWYRRSAEAGEPEAQNRLGVKYAEGKGVQKSVAEALKWFIIAAANGDEKAVENRDKAEKSLSAADVKKAQALAAEWMKKNKPK